MEITETIINWCQENSIQYFASDSTESTNTFAKTKINELVNDSCLIITKEQTQGRGRGNNSWITPGKDKSLLFSLLVKLEGPAQPISSPLIGLCLYRSVKNTWPKINWTIKPPNDLKINNKKVAGILLEAIQQGSENYLIIGVGLNILQHPENLPDATHLNSKDGLSGEFKVEQLQDFFDWFISEIDKSLVHLTNTILEDSSCQELSEAIGNAKIDPNGDIHKEGQTISWKDL